MQLVDIKPQFDLTDFYLEFFEKGIVVFDGTSVLKDFHLSSLQKLEQMFPDYSLATDVGCPNYDRNAHDDIAINKLMADLLKLDLPVDPDSIKFHFLEYRTNPDVYRWHNDNGSNFKGHNVTINCFFDDAFENTGGRFDVSDKVDDTPNNTADTASMHSFYPKKFSIVVFNQNPEWKHKVTHSSRLRRMISFAAKHM